MNHIIYFSWSISSLGFSCFIKDFNCSRPELKSRWTRFAATKVHIERYTLKAKPYEARVDQPRQSKHHIVTLQKQKWHHHQVHEIIWFILIHLEPATVNHLHRHHPHHHQTLLLLLLLHVLRFHDHINQQWAPGTWGPHPGCTHSPSTLSIFEKWSNCQTPLFLVVCEKKKPSVGPEVVTGRMVDWLLKAQWWRRSVNGLCLCLRGITLYNHYMKRQQ